MADFSGRGPDCDSGKRGKRGPRGERGPAGPGESLTIPDTDPDTLLIAKEDGAPGCPIISADDPMARLARNDTEVMVRAIGLLGPAGMTAGQPVQSWTAAGALTLSTAQWDSRTGEAGGLVTGDAYYVGATPGSLTRNPPSIELFTRQVGVAITPTSMNVQVFGFSFGIAKGAPNTIAIFGADGRLRDDLKTTMTPAEMVIRRNNGIGSPAFRVGRDSRSVSVGNSVASGVESFAQGAGAEASGPSSHAEGSSTRAQGGSSHAEGASTTASGLEAHAEGFLTLATESASHAEGIRSVSSGGGSHAEGADTTASGEASHAEGKGTVASGFYSHAEGENTAASGGASHAEGGHTTASGPTSHAEGSNTLASSNDAHAEGGQTTASGFRSHAQGTQTMASGQAAHAEGGQTVASGLMAHAEGGITVASGEASHAQGRITTASGDASHAEGFQTIASGDFSRAQGEQSHASRRSQDSYASGCFDAAGDAQTSVLVFRGSVPGIAENESIVLGFGVDETFSLQDNKGYAVKVTASCAGTQDSPQAVTRTLERSFNARCGGGVAVLTAVQPLLSYGDVEAVAWELNVSVVGNTVALTFATGSEATISAVNVAAKVEFTEVSVKVPSP